jgi:hypothetical protein
MRHSWLLAVWAGTFAASAARAAGPAVPVVVKAVPAPEWEEKFAGKHGWIGADGVYSAVLGPGRVLWFFGDTILGDVKDGRRVNAVMVNNTLGLQSGQDKDAAIRFVAGEGKDGKPAAVFTPADGVGWFWPLGSVVSGGKLYVFLTQIDKAGAGGPFGFKQLGQVLAVVENPKDEPEKWRLKQHKVPFSKSEPARERSWGSAVLLAGNDLYVYGCDELRQKSATNKRLTVARVAAGQVTDFSAWRFRTADGWSDKPADAAPLASRLANEFSVTPLSGGKGYVAVYTEGGLSDRIVGRFADAPEGPWSEPVLLYKCPDVRNDKGVFAYAAKAHAWAAGENELVVSYCVNAWEFGRLFSDEKVYRPKFVRVELRAAK